LLSDLHFDSSWTLFLDRDGVINKKIDEDYVRSISSFEWLPGSLDALAKLAPLFKTVVVVTNQQGVGKGLMSENELRSVHEHMLHNVRIHGGRIDAVYFAPWLKDQNHPERKPGIGMAEKAKRDFPLINFERSIMVGDSLSDVEFGKQAGMYTVLIGNVPEAIAARQPDFVFPSLLEFANALRAEFSGKR
jgi:histidinol-phosphate phosphatase family protein